MKLRSTRNRVRIILALSSPLVLASVIPLLADDAEVVADLLVLPTQESPFGYGPAGVPSTLFPPASPAPELHNLKVPLSKSFREASAPPDPSWKTLPSSPITEMCLKTKLLHGILATLYRRQMVIPRNLKEIRHTLLYYVQMFHPFRLQVTRIELYSRGFDGQPVTQVWDKAGAHVPWCYWTSQNSNHPQALTPDQMEGETRRLQDLFGKLLLFYPENFEIYGSRG